ncbi:MAG: hypothetical protein ACYC3H_08910 [Bellilinea sp.]
MKKKFGVLRLISWVLRVLGALALIAALIAAVASLVGGFTRGPGAMGQFWSGGMMSYWGGLYYLLVGLFSGILLYGAGEVIELLLAIEENIRAVRQLPESRPEPPPEQ